MSFRSRATAPRRIGRRWYWGGRPRARAGRPLDLDALQTRCLQRQHYRLAYWRTAQEELNYRRFFTIDSLIGLRVELEQVLKDSHRLVFELLAGGDVAGLRVDHVDGLLDPKATSRPFDRPHQTHTWWSRRSSSSTKASPAEFPVQGTTGYDFIGHVDGVFRPTRRTRSR